MFNSSPELEQPGQESGPTAPFYNTTAHVEIWVPWTCTIGIMNGEVHMGLSAKVVLCQDVGFLTRSLLCCKRFDARCITLETRKRMEV